MVLLRESTGLCVRDFVLHHNILFKGLFTVLFEDYLTPILDYDLSPSTFYLNPSTTHLQLCIRVSITNKIIRKE